MQSKMVGGADKATFKRASEASKVGQHPTPATKDLLKNESSFFPFGKNGAGVRFEPHELRSMT